MLEVVNKNWKIVISNVEKKEIIFDTNTKKVLLDDFDVSHPWEYEKSNILLEVKEYEDKLFYNFFIDSKHLVIITEDNFKQEEEISNFFWDVDILIIVWSKESAKIFENIESKLVIPYWEAKDLFLTTLGQHIEEVDSYKIKWDFSLDSTEFVNLK
jgi:hypothetical protein